MNVSAVAQALSCVFKPSRLLPSLVVEEFSDLPIDISEALSRCRTRVGPNEDGNRGHGIRALVLDKDNCFAAPLQTDVCAKYQDRWRLLRRQFPGDQILIVSNSAGTSDDAAAREAQEIEAKLKTKVLIHNTKKPGCYGQVMEYLRSSDAKVDHPSQVVVIGDRLFTDVLMANLMGSHSIWLRAGAVRDEGLLSRFEYASYDTLKKWDAR